MIKFKTHHLQDFSKENVLKPFSQKKPRKKRFKGQTITGMIPNITTLVALCCGMTSIRFALLGNWQYAVIAVLVATILDALDGRLARLLNSSSRFGAELDSLSDFLCFGVAPSLIIYLKSLEQWGEVGWVISLFFTVCMALRLARFNVMSLNTTQPLWMNAFFLGIPAPFGGFLALMPIVLSSAFTQHASFCVQPQICALFMLFSASMMVSRIPTFSLKKTFITTRLILPLLLCICIAIGALYSYPWHTLSLIGFVYILIIPLSIKRFHLLSNHGQNQTDPSEEK